jgi:hypothetical protein
MNPRLTDQILLLEVMRLRETAREYAEDAEHSEKQADAIARSRNGFPGNLLAASRYRQQATASRQCAALYAGLADEIEDKIGAQWSPAACIA